MIGKREAQVCLLNDDTKRVTDDQKKCIDDTKKRSKKVIAKLDEDGKKLFRGIIREKLNDVKALSKSRNWKKGVIRKMKQRKAMQGMSKDQRIAYRSEIQAQRKAKRERRNDRKDKRQERKEARGTGGFADEVTNRQSGAMWGGYRNDGLPTNADARRPMTRRIKYNERRS